MDYVRLGRTGLEVSRICLGCMSYGVPERGSHPWSMGEEQSRPFIQRALELGINFFDTSNSYSDGTSEEIVGRALRDFAGRDEVVLATKLFFRWGDRPNQGGLSRKAGRSAVQGVAVVAMLALYGLSSIGTYGMTALGLGGVTALSLAASSQPAQARRRRRRCS